MTGSCFGGSTTCMLQGCEELRKMMLSSAIARSRNWWPSVWLNAQDKIQSEKLEARFTTNGSCFLSPLSWAANFVRVRSKFFTVDSIINFSFALVIATYKTRISSDSFSLFISNAMASLGNVVYLQLVSKSRSFTPRPKRGCSKASFCSLLNGLEQRAKMQIGNSKPLERWMLMIFTASAPSDITEAAGKSASCFCKRSM